MGNKKDMSWPFWLKIWLILLIVSNISLLVFVFTNWFIFVDEYGNLNWFLFVDEYGNLR